MSSRSSTPVSAPGPPTSPDLALAAIARRQHGAWSLAQARTAGFTPAMVRSRRQSGRWIPLDSGVYADASSIPTWHRQVTAAVLAEPWAAASHRCVAALRGVSGFRQGLIEITTRPGANVRGRLALVHRGTDVQTTFVDGIRCSTVAQMFIDLAQVVSERRIFHALDEAVVRHPEVLDQVRSRYLALTPRGGRDLRPLRAALERFTDDHVPTASELERALRNLVYDAPLPEVHWEAPFPGRQTGSLRVDCLIREWMLVVEVDGRAWHTRLADFEKDRRRDSEAASFGYQTLRFTWAQVMNEPEWVRGCLLETGAHRSAAA